MAMVARGPWALRLSSAGTPRTSSSAMRNSGTRASAAGSASRPDRSSRTPLLTRNKGEAGSQPDDEPDHVADRGQYQDAAAQPAQVDLQAREEQQERKPEQG
jgi:hypothetical protein